MEPLSPYALGTADELLRHLGLLESGKEGDRDRGVVSGNAAVDWLERYTARALRVRTHRNPVTLTLGDWTAGASVITGIASTTDAKVHDDLVGTGLAIGSRIVSVDSASQITVNTVLEGTGTNVALTAGSRPLVLDGSGAGDIYVPEAPLHDVYGVAYRDFSGTLVAISISGAYVVEYRTGLYRLIAESVPAGVFNVEVECLAGYRPPSATERGDREWWALNRLWLRVAEVFYQEKTRHAGRITSQSLGQATMNYDARMPLDVLVDAAPFVRRP